MIKSLKQLFADLQDKSAGQKISQWPVKTPLILWSKFYILFAVIVTLSLVYSLVYFVPQIPKLISNAVPDITLSFQKGSLSITPDDPIKLISTEGSFVVDTRSEPEDYAYLKTGVFIFRDYWEARDNSGQYQKSNYQNMPDFSVTRGQIIDWFQSNKTKIIFVLIPVVLLFSLIFSGIVWATRVLGFYIWAGVLYLAFKLFKRQLSYSQILPVVVYASIFPLLISYILFFAPHPLLNLLNFTLFVFFTLSWLLPLTATAIKNIDTPKKLSKKK